MRAVVKHTANAMHVGIKNAATVHFMLPVSFFMVHIVVEQGQ